MSSNKHQNRNLAARMGRWSAAHWKTATFGWLALVVVAFGIGGQVGTKQIDPNAKGPGESGRMDKILDAGFKQPAGESVLIQNRSLQAGTPAFAAAVDDVVARLSKVAVVRNIQAPKIADDRHRSEERRESRPRLVDVAEHAAVRGAQLREAALGQAAVELGPDSVSQLGQQCDEWSLCVWHHSW